MYRKYDDVYVDGYKIDPVLIIPESDYCLNPWDERTKPKKKKKPVGKKVTKSLKKNGK